MFYAGHRWYMCCCVRVPSACTMGPSDPLSLSLLESDTMIGIGAVWFAVAEASPPLITIGHISMFGVVHMMVLPSGAGHGNRVGNSHI